MNYTRVDVGRSRALVYHSSIGGMYATLYTDVDMFDYLRTVSAPKYTIKLQGLTDVDRLVWHIIPKQKGENSCMEFINNLNKDPDKKA